MPSTDLSTMIESGYGTTLDTKSNEDGSNGYATSSVTASSLTCSVSSTDDGDATASEDDTETIDKRPMWLLPFFINIFLACASFSIVMPSLAPYLLNIGVPLSFLPWIVSSYSVGEMLGSIAIGHFYEYAGKTFETVGLGPRISMMICIMLGIIGSALYSVAGWIENEKTAKYCLFAARLIQGLWTGGQQSVEQAYLSAAVHPSKRTEHTAILSTCAVLGFVLGPAIGAFLSLIDTTIFGLPINAANAAGIFMLGATLLMFVQTALFFDGKDDTTCGATTEQKGDDNDTNNTSDSTRTGLDEAPFNHMGVALCMVIFYIHYYSFAVQETIITPMVMMLYGWKQLEINLLFIGAGLVSLITSFSVRYLTRYVEDRVLLMTSIIIGFVGSLLLVDLPFNQALPIWRFLLGFSLITVAFPIGRNVVLGIYGNVLGDVNQGRWMGMIFAVSALPRVIGPFISLELLLAVDWHTWLEFGICACLFGMTFLATWRQSDELVPFSEYANEERKSLKENQLLPSHSPMPSPMVKSPPSRRRMRKR